MPIPTEIPRNVLKKARDLAAPGVTKPFYILKLSLAAMGYKKHHFADLVSGDERFVPPNVFYESSSLEGLNERVGKGN